jgi:hypothetical protein
MNFIQSNMMKRFCQTVVSWLVSLAVAPTLINGNKWLEFMAEAALEGEQFKC